MNSLMLLGAGVETICHDSSNILQIVGWVLTVFKIAIPLIIIVLGVIDLAKAAISSKPEEISKSVTSLVWRIVGGIAIFFIPALIMMLFRFIGDYRDTEGSVDFDTCYNCIITPWDGCE